MLFLRECITRFAVGRIDKEKPFGFDLVLILQTFRENRGVTFKYTKLSIYQGIN